MIAYVMTQGARIVRQGRHLLVLKDGNIHHTLFTYRLEQVVLFGNVSLTPPALKMLLREGVDTVFLTLDGRYLGRFAQDDPKNVLLRRRQFEMSGDVSFRLKVAADIVNGKLLNMATLLMRIRRTRGVKEPGEAADAIRQLARRTPEAATLESLRGLEGQGTALYFKALRFGMDRDYGFRRRVRRPPTDPMNAVLSLLYTFSINRAYAAVRLAGLDPAPGILHDLDYGRHALPLDVVEEFRAILADSLALSLFNLGVLKEKDFCYLKPDLRAQADGQEDQEYRAANDPLGQVAMPDDTEFFDLPEQSMTEQEQPACDGKYPCRLTPDALKRVIAAFSKKLGTEFNHPLAGRKMTYGEAMIFQARQLRNVIEGKASRYEPLLMR